jgi:ABC-type nickel/cobalt efflux system permease component RcnA
MSELHHWFLSLIISWQQEINLAISNAFDALEAGEGGMFLYIILVAFIYGLVHALGPGHGKMVIASYFLARGSHIKDALNAAFLTAAIHAFSALFITMILFFFFQSSITHYFQTINQNMYKLSAIFIIFVALFLLFETLKHKNETETFPSKKGYDTNILKIAFSIGIVPCPGVMSIVLFAMILGYYTLGILSAISMSLGMGITMSLAAIIATKVKKTSLHSRYRKSLHVLSFIGIFLLLSLGVFILL